MATAVAQLGALLEQLQARVADLEKRAGVAPPVAAVGGGGASSSSAVDDEPTAQTRAWDELVTKFGEPLAHVADKIGGDCAVMGKAWLALWKANRKLIDIATKCKKPDAAKLTELRQEVLAAAKPIFDAKAKRDCTHPNHATGTADAAPAFAWVNMDMGPLDSINNAKEACDFYLNKVRKQAKDDNKPEWKTYADLIRDGLNGVYEYVKENYKTGLAFNPKGVDVATYTGSAGAKPAAAPAPTVAAGGAGASSSSTPSAAAPKKDAASLQSALFAQLGSIEQTEKGTVGLRHVTKDMKASAQKDKAPVPVKTPTAAVGGGAASSGRSVAIPTGTARCELVDKRWYVEFQQERGAQLHIPPAGSESDLTMAQEVYLYACKDIVVFVDKKCKGVRIDKCHNVTVIMQAVLSGVEIVDSKKMKIQAQQALPSVAVDKTDGIVIGLAWPARECQIVTSKSSEMNVTFPISAAEDADWIELPIPEQFVSKVTAENKVHTTVSELYTA